jgi:filamin
VDPKKCTATGAGLSNAVLNQPAVFRVHTKDAGQSKLDVAVIGPDGVALPVSVDQDGPDEYICSYTPTARGDHSIDAKWEGIPIPGTPFRVAPSVLADASKCIVIDLPTGYLRANKEAHFLVDTSAAGDGDLKVSAHGPSIPQKCDIQSIDSTNYKVSFSPFEVGELTVDVKFADGDVKDSPFKFKVNDPTKCNVNSSAISSGTYTIKQKVDFRVSTQFAGEGELTAKVHGPKGSEDFKIEDKGEGVYLIGFTPNTPGAHAIEIFFDNEAIPNTPVNFFVGAGSGSDDVVVIQPAADRKGLFIVDAPHEYKINASNANEGELTANCVGVFTGAKPKLDIVDNGDRHYSVLLTAAAPDEYKLNILWSNDPVPGSQFTINISDKPHPDKVLVRGPVYEIGSQDMELVANVTSAGSGEITASCRGQRAGSVPVEIDSTEPGTYEMKIKGTMCDLYTISVFWSDEHVPGSPFKVNNIPPNAGKVIVTKPDHFARSVRSVFKVDATDAGVGYLKAYCKAESSANLPVEIEKPDPLQERYRCTVTPIREDVYQLSILWSDKNVPDSPFTIDLVPKLHADRVIVEDPVFSTSGQPVLTNVETTNAGNGKLTAECIGKVSGNVPVDIKETEVGKYVLEFMPPKEDDYKLRIFFENEEVPRSPQNISIHPIQETFDYVIIDPPESEIIITDYLGEIHQPPPENVEKDPAEMSMMIGDILRMDIVNPTPEKVPELESVHPIEPEKQLTATAVGDVNGSAEIEVKKNGPDDYVIKFNPTKPDRYVITVMNGNEELPESPVIVRYITPVDASKCFIFDLEKNSAHPLIGETVQFGVDASKAGKGDLRVTTDGPSDSQNESNLKIEEDPDKSGVYHITYRLPEVAGEQRVHVQWSNNNIPGSPLVFNVASGSAITGETVYPYGSLVVLGLNAECKPKELDAFAVLEGTNQRVKLKATKVGKGQFKLSGQPTTPGHYAVHVRIKEIDVAGSPYRIRYSDPPNPSKVKVDIQPSDLAFLYYPIVFNIDTKEAGLGDVALRSNVRRKTKDKSPEFEVVDNKDGTYTATYIPMQTTIHSFEVLFANQPVPGFPVKMNVIEKPAQIDHILSSNLNLMEVNKSVALYFRLPPGDSISSITASATGRTIQDPDFKLENVKDNLCCARFTPSVPDDYQLEVQHRNSPIAGSPFPVKVVDKESFEPSKSTELFQNPPVVEAKRPFTLILPIIQPDMSQGDFVTDIDGPPESDVVSSGVIGDGHGAFALSFTPDLPGDYVIHVKDSKEDCPISGSPYRVIVKEFHSDPTKCFIIPEDAQLFEKSQRFGKPVNFRISTIDAGPGTLNITSRGPGKADVKIFDNNDGTYTCEFTPSVPGQYGIDILWDTQHIEGSPYNLNFKNRKKKVITGLNLDAENFRVGIPHRFKLHCDEVGDGELEVNIKPASAAQVKVSNLGSFTYQVEILPFEQGHHELVVHYGGTHILGSPYNVTFNERGDASKCKMISNDVEQVGDDQDHVVFIVSTKDAGNGKLTAHVDNPNSGERDPVLIDKLEEDIYKVHFDLGSEAEYQLTIKYDGNHIEGSPFKLLFADQIDASICRAEGDGLRISQIEKEAKFSVYTEGAGEADLKVQIVSKEGYEIYPHVSNLGEGEYEVSYNSTKPGEYMISIQWGEDNIPSSPFSMKCFVPVQAAYLKVIDPPSEAFLETPIEVKVKPINEMNEEGELMIMAKSRQANIVGTVKQEEDGSYTCHLEPVLPGRYVVKVTLNGDSIQNSPFKVKVVEPPKPQNVKAYGPGLKDGFVGQEGNFTLETGEAGSGTLSVRVHGPKGAFRINMRRHPDNERTILVRYDPKYSGRYSIDVTWSEEHIPGSPFKVEILEQKEKERSLTNGTSNEEESKANENEETNDKDEEKIDTVADVHVST